MALTGIDDALIMAALSASARAARGGEEGFGAGVGAAAKCPHYRMGQRCGPGQSALPMKRHRRRTCSSTMSTMMDLKSWLREQGLSARGLARLLEVPRTTVQDWVYRGTVPSAGNAERLTDFIASNCAHHWVIAAPNGPTSEGVCQRCGEKREFTNSAESTSMWLRGSWMIRPKA